MRYLLQRSFASTCLDIVKIRALTPCKVEDPLTHYKGTIVEVVFDPLRIEEVNSKFKASGFIIRKGMQVIALNEDGSILLWGGVNSVFYLRKGEDIWGDFDNLAFQDIGDLTKHFMIKNKKVEIDAMLAQLKQTYGEEK